jgi:hypothetical protein
MAGSKVNECGPSVRSPAGRLQTAATLRPRPQNGAKTVRFAD